MAEARTPDSVRAASRGRAPEELARMVADRGQGWVTGCRVTKPLTDRSQASCLHPDGHDEAP